MYILFFDLQATQYQNVFSYLVRRPQDPAKYGNFLWNKTVDIIPTELFNIFSTLQIETFMNFCLICFIWQTTKLCTNVKWKKNIFFFRWDVHNEIFKAEINKV